MNFGSEEFPLLPHTSTELRLKMDVTPGEVQRTLWHYADRGFYIPGDEMVKVIERSNSGPEDLEALITIATKGIISAVRYHRIDEPNNFPEYPNMIKAVQAGYAQILGYAGCRLEELK